MEHHLPQTSRSSDSRQQHALQYSFYNI